MEIIVEKRITISSGPEQTELLGTKLVKENVSQKLIQRIKKLANTDEEDLYDEFGWRWSHELNKMFKNQLGYSLWNTAGLLIDGQWYKIDYLTYGTDTTYAIDNINKAADRIHGDPSEKDWQLYKRYKNIPENAGPFGGAFSSWEDYYRHKGVTPDTY